MLSRLACGVAVAFVALAGSASAATTPNLIANPGAEAGPAATEESQSVTPSGWAPTGNASAYSYGVSNHPTPAFAAQIGGGVNFFAGGPNTARTGLSQDFDITRFAPLIDGGNATLRLSGFLGGLTGQDDTAAVTASLFDAAGAPAVNAVIGPVARAERSGTTMVPRAACVPVPAGVRGARVSIDFVRADGRGNNGTADNLSLTLSDVPCAAAGVAALEPAVPPQAGVSGSADLVKGSVGIRLPGSGGFAPLADVSKLPVGSEVDATRGVLSIESAAGTAGATQTARFSEGQFVMTQPQNAALTDIRLSADFAKCPRGSSRGAGRAVRSRRLWGNGNGRFRTRGRRASATVRGRVRWLTQDTCAGTLIRVTRGSLIVRDFGKKRNIRLKAPARYLAK